MYISELKLWNFRKYGREGDIDLERPDLVVPFTKGLNVLIGENDSGKSAIVDALKLVLKTHSVDWIKIEDNDFHNGQKALRIEVIIVDLSDDEASKFNGKLELSENDFRLHLMLRAEKRNGRIFPNEVLCLQNGIEEQLNAIQREFLRITYLKALRDADNELTSKKGSRISQILMGHQTFRDGGQGKKAFENIFSGVKIQVDKWFKTDSEGRTIKEIIDNFLKSFISDNKTSNFSISEAKIRTILEKISIEINGSLNLGLGTLNRLYMATELLHLKQTDVSLKSCFVEELEAHLHPQAQMKVIEALQKESNNGVQFVLTTHSPNLASKIKLNGDNTSVILCKDNDVYPLTKGRTKLERDDYKYLDHFLDVTKSNLFFAKGIILVEGMAEEILLPVLARKIQESLTKSEVSIVNVGSTAYLHFARILMRNDGKELDFPVSIVTDKDVRPKYDETNKYYLDEFDLNEEQNKEDSIKTKIDPLSNVELFLAPHWTLEWCLFKSTALSLYFKKVCSEVHSRTTEFQPDSDGNFDEEVFRKKLSEKLADRSLDKVQIATLLTMKIADENIEFGNNDEAIYLINAIRHVCK